MHDWSAAWASQGRRSFLSFTTRILFRRATENFDAFRQNKERLSKSSISSKFTITRKSMFWKGPGYWVTWTEQFYTASNLSQKAYASFGGKGGDNKFRIVEKNGMDAARCGDARRFPAGATCGRKYSQFGEATRRAKTDCAESGMYARNGRR